MATTTVTEQIPTEILEDLRDSIIQAEKRTQEAAQHRARAAHLEGEASGFRAAADRICERKLKAGKKDEIDIETGTITRVVEVADHEPVDPPSPPPSDWFEPPANEDYSR